MTLGLNLKAAAQNSLRIAYSDDFALTELNLLYF